MAESSDADSILPCPHALPFSVLQAAWSVILSAYVGAQNNVIFGTCLTFPNGLAKDPDHVIIPTEPPLFDHGDCIPTTIGDALKQLTKSTRHKARSKLQALQHSTRLDQLSGNGTLVAFHDEDLSGVRRQTTRETSEENSFALSISAFPSNDSSLVLQANYTDLVMDEASAQVVLAQLDDVIVYIVSNLSKPLHSSRTAVRPSLLSISNQHVPEVNGFHAEAPLLHSQFENTAKEYPNVPALEFWNDIHTQNFTRLTYGELNARADAFARYLNHHFGQLFDQPIPLCMERCPELYIAILGILKAGGAWCPVDASFPARRRHDLIVRTGSPILIIADQDLAIKTDGIPQGVVVVDINKIDTAGGQQVDLADVHMGSLAYLIWTSGTTGAPKGVPIHHEAALTSMRAVQRSIPVDVNGDVVRCMQFSHFTFDVFVQDLFYTWGVGGSIVSSTRSIMLGSFAELANKAKATHAHLTPAFAASVPREKCTSLEVITMIGEKLTQAVADDWGHNMRAYNTYGPAETTVVSTLRQFGSVEDEIRSENVGYPLPSVSAFVVRDGYPLMRHGVGELALGGPQLSKGYWNDPEKTAGHFVWNEHFSRIMYMTGDMVRQLHDGSLVFVGREDDLIKIQGIRVELSEISFGLRACHPLVEQVETQYLERPDRPSKVIVAFLAVPSLEATDAGLVTSGKAAAIATSALTHASQNLADYMIPRVFLVVHSIPKTPSNKIDRNKLKEVYSLSDLGAWEKALATNGGSTIEEAEWSQKNLRIIDAVTELSGTSRDSITRHSDLRSIGIDSIAATRLAPILNARGFSLSIADILRCQKLDDIVNSLERSATRTPRFDLEAFHEKWYERVRKKLRRDGFVVLPSLPLQESLLGESMQNAKAYWSNTFLSLDAQIDLARLKEAWAQVVDNTQALRTGFVPTAAVANNHETTQNTFLQLIYNKVELDWTDLETSDGTLKGFATEQAQRVAERHQANTFVDVPIAITILLQPTTCTMMISIHHSIRDEPSLNFLLEDVWMAYNHGHVKSRHQSREAIQLLFPTDAKVQEDEMYWSEILSNLSTAEEENTFPDLTGHPTKRDERFITHIQQLTTPYKALQDAAVSLGAISAASILRLAWGCILLKYLETESTVFAETWSDRVEDPLLEDIVGPLTSVVPVPFRAAGSARETLMAQSHIQKHSRAHRSIHGRTVRKLLQRPEHRSVYPALFNFLPEASNDTPNELLPVWRRLENLIALTVEHPLALNVAPTANGSVELELIASSHIISGAHLAILAQQVNAVVEAMLRDPDVPLEQSLGHLPANLISKTSVVFSEEVKAASKQDPLHWVDHYAKTQPSWPAAMFFSAIHEAQPECWNYAELQAAYRRVASFIGGHGFHHQMIAVCLDRRLEAYAVLLGILASGNTYLPIDEDLPDERKSFLIQDSQAVMLFTISTLTSTFTNTETRLVLIDDDSYTNVMPNGHPVESEARSDPHDNAYLLYTSGSTGLPKGVLVGRGNLCSFIEGLSEYIQPRIPGMRDLPGKGRYLGLASRAFDVHLAEIFLAWRRGLAAVTAPRTLLLDNLESALRTLRITHASFVPSLIDQAGLDPANLPDLHYLGVGGEKMSKRTVDTWAASKNAALVNAYGPTEMSIGCTATEVTSDSNLRNIGRPYGNSIAHVLVPGSNEYTLRGVAGELCFTGDLVANGYHNRPDAKGFVEDFHGERMYRTGDIVRLMADDTLEYLRREDDQTKVRGQRLELGEISEAIRSSVASTLTSDRIDVATIVAQHPKIPRPQLVNFVVTQRSKTDSIEILRTSQDHQMADSIMDHCQKVLPSYMVPDVVLILSRLPLAPSSGKADQKRLKSLFADAPLEDLINRSVEGKVEQRELTTSERNVRNAVTSTLTVDGADIYPTTNIFRLGLESLSAINLTVRMQKLGYDCNVSTILKNPTLEKLALLPQRKAEQTKPTCSPIAALKTRYLESHPEHSSRIFKPCLPLQETLVASSLSDQSRALYMNNVVLRLSATIDTARLGKAILQVMTDHDILRTCFPEFESGFVQIICEPPSIPWEEVTVTDLNAAAQKMQDTPSIDIIKQIGKKPPLRLTLLRQTANEQNPVLLFQIHHALYDGESFAMVLQDIDKRYHSAVMPAHTSFDTLLQYIFCHDLEEAKPFWQHYLKDFESTNTMHHDASSDHSTTDRVLTTSIADLEDFSASMSGTLTSTVQAAFGIVLAKTFKTNDVVFGAVLSGRTVPIENPNTIVAPCLTTVPQRVNLGTNGSNIVEIMKVATEGFVESLAFQHVALRHIHRWLEVDRPLFDCLVTYVQKKSLFVSDLWTELEGSMANDFPLAVEFEADHETGQVRVHCAFTSAFGDMEKAKSLLENTDLLLGVLARGEAVTTHDLGISKGTGLEPSSKKKWDESEWSPIEMQIRDVAGETSGIRSQDIRKGSSFFSLGIDSIIAIRFAKQLRQCGIDCSSADVMRHTCIGALAQHIGSSQQQFDGVKGPDIGMPELIAGIPVLGQGDAVIDVYQCTPLQSSMLTQTLGFEGRLYAHHHALRLSETINVPDLKHAWGHLIAQTEILRTTFHFATESGLWMAAVHEDCPNTWIESESIDGVTRTFAFHNEASFEHPPWKTTILRNSNEIILVISIHHSLYDGISINLLLQDLAHLYNGVELHPKTPFSDAARMISQTTQDAEDFWLHKLVRYQGSQHLFENGDSGFTNSERTLDLNFGNVLQGCKDLGVTLQTVALLAHAKSLACLSGQRDVVFGHVVGGRSIAIPDADDIVGPLFNTIPSRITLDKTFVSNESMAKDIQQSSGDAQAHQHASLARVQQAWRQKAANGDRQLFDSMFVFMNNTSSNTSIDDLGTPIDLGGAVDPTENSLNVEIEQNRENITLRVNARMNEERLQDWVNIFEQSFQDILEHPDRSVLAFPPSLQSLPVHAKGNTSIATARVDIEPGPDLNAIQEALSVVSQITLKNISSDVSIFSLGLDSIAAIRVAAACRQKGYAVSVADVLQGRTVRGICQRLRERTDKQVPDFPDQQIDTLVPSDTKAKALAVLDVKADEVEQISPCLAGQVFHLASWLKTSRTTCEAVFTYQSSPDLDVKLLRSAWMELCKRHPILRTVFVATSPGKVVQVVLGPSKLKDNSFSSTNANAPIHDLIQQEAAGYFNMFIPPAKLHHIHQNNQDLILLKLHHAIYDAWTIPKLISDLAKLYQNINLPPLQPFTPFITHTLKTLQNSQQLDYWRRSLANAQPTLLTPPATDHSSPSTAAIFISFLSATPSLSAITQKCQSTSISLPSLILTAFGRTLARHTATTHPIFGLYQTGRSASFDCIENLCAPTLNITPVCVPSALSASIEENAERMQKDLAERVPFEQSLLGEILCFAGLRSQKSNSSPAFNAFVNILSSPPDERFGDGNHNDLFMPYHLSPSEVASLHNSPRPTNESMPASMETSTSTNPNTHSSQAKTPIDNLDTTYVSSQDFHLDIVRKDADDTIDIAVKCEGNLMHEDQVRAFVMEMVAEVEGFAGLGRR
ncbi:MAG: hypothetical protein LQ337_006791 [Flavoplaca oasis]|nr:MAG: hypothetical protein LQ337_006791 [Flavoplaca oasis]